MRRWVHVRSDAMALASLDSHLGVNIIFINLNKSFCHHNYNGLTDIVHTLFTGSFS